MSKVRYVTWRPDEWLVGVGGLTPEQRGIYDTVLNLIFSTGAPLDMPEKELAGRCNCDPRTLRRVLGSLESSRKLRRNSDGHWTNTPAEEALKKAHKLIKASQKNGESGGRPPNENNDLQNPAGYSEKTHSLTINDSTKELSATEAEQPPSPKSLIAALDSAIVEVFGEARRRPWPHALDSHFAADLLAAGAVPELVRTVAAGICHRDLAQGKEPPGTMKYIAPAVREALRTQTLTVPTRPAYDPDAQWRGRMRGWRKDGLWVASWGPPPGDPDCQVPRSLLDDAAA